MESTNHYVSLGFLRDSFTTLSTLSNAKDDADTPAPESSSLRQKLKFSLPTKESCRNLINDEGTTQLFLASASYSEKESLFEVEVHLNFFHMITDGSYKILDQAKSMVL